MWYFSHPQCGRAARVSVTAASSVSALPRHITGSVTSSGRAVSDIIPILSFSHLGLEFQSLEHLSFFRQLQSRPSVFGVCKQPEPISQLTCVLSIPPKLSDRSVCKADVFWSFVPCNTAFFFSVVITWSLTSFAVLICILLLIYRVTNGNMALHRQARAMVLKGCPRRGTFRVKLRKCCTNNWVLKSIRGAYTWLSYSHGKKGIS